MPAYRFGSTRGVALSLVSPVASIFGSFTPQSFDVFPISPHNNALAVGQFHVVTKRFNTGSRLDLRLHQSPPLPGTHAKPGHGSLEYDRAVYVGRHNGVRLNGCNARDVSACNGRKTRTRELISKLFCVLDVRVFKT